MPSLFGAGAPTWRWGAGRAVLGLGGVGDFCTKLPLEVMYGRSGSSPLSKPEGVRACTTA